MPPVGQGRRHGPLAKVAAIGACLLFALAAAGNGLDRLAFEKPALAARVPAMFASQSLLGRGQVALLAGSDEAALADGTAAVLSAPIDPISPALLGSARLGLNDPIGAQQAFLVAGRMGWRVPLTQIYWMQRAIGLRNWPVAGMRADALLRQHPWMLANVPLLSPLEGSPRGREAIVNRLASAPPWLYPYASEVDQVPIGTITERMLVLQALASRGVRVGCDRIALPANRLAQSGAFTDAQALWRSHCETATPGLLADPDLANLRLNGARSLFEWDLVGSSEVGIAIVPGTAQGTQMVQAHNSGAVPRVLLRQLVTASPGTYRLDWLAQTANGKPTEQVTASLTCSGEGGSPVAATTTSEGRRQAALVIPSDCPAHWLAFSILPGSDDIRLGGFRLSAVR